MWPEQQIEDIRAALGSIEGVEITLDGHTHPEFITVTVAGAGGQRSGQVTRQQIEGQDARAVAESLRSLAAEVGAHAT